MGGALCLKEEALGAWPAGQVQLRFLPKSVGRPALQAGEPGADTVGVVAQEA